MLYYIKDSYDDMKPTSQTLSYIYDFRKQISYLKISKYSGDVSE